MKKPFITALHVVLLLSLSGCGSGDRSAELEKKILDDCSRQGYSVQSIDLRKQDTDNYSGTVVYPNGQTGTITVKIEWTGPVTYRTESFNYDIQPN